MNIAIIGNGISGITAARFIRKLSDHNITVISSETDHFFSRTALMYVYMGHLRYVDIKPYEDWFWEKNRIDLLRAHVERVDIPNKTLHFSGDTPPMPFDKLIIGCGSSPNKFGWPGQDLNRVQGLYSYQDLQSMERHSDGLQRAVIVGGGLIGIEMAEMFHSRHIPVSFLVREDSFWNMVLPAEESAMVSRHIVDHGIDLRLNTELDTIVDDGSGNACAVTTKDGQRIECGMVGLTAGVHPNIDFLKESELETQKGIVVNDYLQTNISDIYAIGDCAQIREPQPNRRSIEAVWYTGRMMGETVAYNVCGQRVKYDPGIWFNSAKFMDIEYQVYGDIKANPPDHHRSIYWEHEDGRRSIRLTYDQDSLEIVGFNLMGVRFRHEVCDQWLRQKACVESVLQDLRLANFDPEFYKTFEQEVIRIYNEQSGKNIKLKQKRSWDKVFSFLHS